MWQTFLNITKILIFRNEESLRKQIQLVFYILVSEDVGHDMLALIANLYLKFRVNLNSCNTNPRGSLDL